MQCRTSAGARPGGNRRVKFKESAVPKSFQVSCQTSVENNHRQLTLRLYHNHMIVVQFEHEEATLCPVRESLHSQGTGIAKP
jgi:hypothetical protein